MDIYLLHATALTPFDRIPDSFIHIHDGKILYLEPFREQTLPLSAHRVDATGLIAAPGWIDVQVNGGFGLDFTQDPASIWEVARQLPALGTTAFLPTIITAPLEVVDEAMRVLRAGPPAGWRGALPLGLHLEGPFLNPARKGAHNPGPPAPARIRFAEELDAPEQRAPGHPGPRTARRHEGRRATARAGGGGQRRPFHGHL